MYIHNLKWIGFNIISGKFQFKNHCLSGLLQWSSEAQWLRETQENTLALFDWAFNLLLLLQKPKANQIKGPKATYAFAQKQLLF